MMIYDAIRCDDFLLLSLDCTTLAPSTTTGSNVVVVVVGFFKISTGRMTWNARHVQCGIA